MSYSAKRRIRRNVADPTPRPPNHAYPLPMIETFDLVYNL
jgi:hypothetical protein